MAGPVTPTCGHDLVMWNCKCGLKPGHLGPHWCPTCESQWEMDAGGVLRPVSWPKHPHPEP